MTRKRIAGLLVLVLVLLPVSASAQDRETQFFWAAKKGDTATLKAFLQAGVNVNARDLFGMTALMWAADGGHSQSVRTLLAAGASVNATAKNGGTALTRAAESGDTETVKTLLAVGADINAALESGSTALMAAASRGRTETVKILLAAGADVNAAARDRRTWNTEPPDHTKSQTERERLLILASSRDGYTALMAAAFDGHVPTIRTLLAAGANVNAKAKNGTTALHQAVGGRGGTETVAELLAAGADPSARSGVGITVLGTAEFITRKEIRKEIVELLKKAGARQ